MLREALPPTRERRFRNSGALRLLVRTRGGFGFGGLLLAALLFLGFALALRFRFALMRVFLAAAIRLQALVLFVVALLLGFLQLAHGVLALDVAAGFFGNDAALDVGALGADFDVHRLGASGAAGARRGHLQLTHLAAFERDLAWRAVVRFGGGEFALAVGAAQEAQQLHLLGAADDLLRIGEFHTGLGQLSEQLVHRHAKYLGELFDRYVRHRVLSPPFPR